MAGVPPPLCLSLLVLVTLCGCGLMGVVRSATMEQIGNLVKGPLWNQTELNVYNSNLSGPIPPALGSLVNLTYVNLSTNALSGQIPPSLSNLTNLAYLDLSSNKLSGPIPLELGSLANLQSINLSVNSFSGPIPPELSSLTSLQYLFLGNNDFSGPIPLELGNLTNLVALQLSNNNLFGPIPRQLGSLTKLNALALAFNKLLGLVPPELGRLIRLNYLFLNDNRLSGPIPLELSSLTKLNHLDLSNNNLSGPIPPELSSLTDLKNLSLGLNRLSGPIPASLGKLSNLTGLLLSGNNDLSGPIPSELGSLRNLTFVDLTWTSTTCNNVDFSQWRSLLALGIPCLPPPSVHNTSIRFLFFHQPHGRNEERIQNLDLSRVPHSCKVVVLEPPFPQLESIQLWEGCHEGCIVFMKGSGARSRARLSRSTRRKVCLSRISILLEGTFFYTPFDFNDFSNPFKNTLRNEQGRVFNLSDPNVFDNIDLGSRGITYTGVGFSRVREGNLCGNPEAKYMVAMVYVAFSVALLLATLLIITVARRRRAKSSFGTGVQKGHRSSLKSGILYLWGAVLGVLPVVDIATDFLVLREVWGVWPMWVILASVCVPFVVGAYTVVKSWGATRSSVRGWKGMRVTWMWPLPELNENESAGKGKVTLLSELLRILLLPLGLLGVLVQDLLSVAERFGLHLAWGDEIVVFERYHEARALVELLLESLPQAIFQSALYVLGSSRATRIYIDQRLFVQSIVVSLCSLSIQYCCMLWEAVYEGKSLVRVFLNRFKSAGQPIVVRILDDGSNNGETIFGKEDF